MATFTFLFDDHDIWMPLREIGLTPNDCPPEIWAPESPLKAFREAGDHSMLIYQWPHAAWTWTPLCWVQKFSKIVTTNPSASALRTMPYILCDIDNVIRHTWDSIF